MTQSWPTEIRLTQDKRSLAVSFNDGTNYVFPAEFLRVTSPSAEVQGHNADQKKTIGGKRNVEIMNIEPVGNYAVRLSFTDLHDTGFYTWDYFHKSGQSMDQIWQGYLSDLEAKGLTRG